MTAIVITTYQCDGCLGKSESKKFIVATYVVTKIEHGGDQPRKYTRDYCETCIPKIMDAHTQGAFRSNRRELI